MIEVKSAPETLLNSSKSCAMTMLLHFVWFTFCNLLTVPVFILKDHHFLFVLTRTVHFGQSIFVLSLTLTQCFNHKYVEFRDA